MSVVPPQNTESSTDPSATQPNDAVEVRDLEQEEPQHSAKVVDAKPVTPVTKPYNLDEAREGTRGDLARGLLWLLTLTIGALILFVGMGRLDGAMIAQSVFPSLVTLAGTALGFYFGSQTTGSASS
jgi:hypothetical protein